MFYNFNYLENSQKSDFIMMLITGKFVTRGGKCAQWLKWHGASRAVNTFVIAALIMLSGCTHVG